MSDSQNFSLKPIIHDIAALLVEKPDQIEVFETISSGTMVYQLKVAPTDVGKVIGKQGRTADAIRLLATNAGGKRGFRVVFDVFLYDKPNAPRVP